MRHKNIKQSGFINKCSHGSKKFYSAGATFSALTCGLLVQLVWAIIAKLCPLLDSVYTGLTLSALIVIAYALVLPEPRGYPDEGKLRITPAEWIFGLFNIFVVFGVALAFKELLK